MTQDNLAYAYALSRLTTYCFLRSGYEYPSAMTEAIELSESADDLFAEIQRSNPKLPKSAVLAAIAGRFSGRDGLYLDLDKSDLASWRKELSAAVVSRDITYPWVFGRSLHDKYTSLYGGGIGEISHEQSAFLLDGMPQGVAQVGDLVAGPYGILSSDALRMVDPADLGVAMKCQDPGCASVHIVPLRTGETSAGKAFREVNRLAGRTPRDLGQVLDRSTRQSGAYYSPSATDGLPALLGNGLTQSELKKLCLSLAQGGSHTVRDAIAGIARSSQNRAIAKHVAGAEPAEILQLTLLANDGAIVRTIDDLLASGDFELEPTEIRRAIIPPYRIAGMFRPRSELGSLGVRVSASLKPTERLYALVLDAYSGREDELDWRLRRLQGGTVQEKLRSFIRERAPREVIADLLFGSREAFEATLKNLDRAHWGFPASDEEEFRVAERVAWQVGLDPRLPVTPDAHVRGACLKLIEVAQTRHPSFDDYASAVRSAGNEAFVRLEEFLDCCLAFTVWALTADHYGRDLRDRFEYSPRRARVAANAFIASRTPRGADWDVGGRNSIGTMLDVWGAVSTVLAKSAPLESDLRPLSEVPHFALHTSVVPFPFRHRMLWFDLSSTSRETVVRVIGDVVSVLRRVVGFRNRMSHQSPDSFPEPTDGVATAGAIISAMDLLVEIGMVPNVRRVSSVSRDEHGRSTAVLCDSSGRGVVVSTPPDLLHVSMPSISATQLVFSGISLEGVGSAPRFRVDVDSAWRDEWRDFADPKSTPADAAEEYESSLG